jgi:hypothetical protein
MSSASIDLRRRTYGFTAGSATRAGRGGWASGRTVSRVSMSGLSSRAMRFRRTVAHPARRCAKRFGRHGRIGHRSCLKSIRLQGGHMRSSWNRGVASPVGLRGHVVKHIGICKRPLTPRTASTGRPPTLAIGPHGQQPAPAVTESERDGPACSGAAAYATSVPLTLRPRIEASMLSPLADEATHRRRNRARTDL